MRIEDGTEGAGVDSLSAEQSGLSTVIGRGRQRRGIDPARRLVSACRTVACAAPARKLLLPVPSQETYGSRRMRADFFF
jgi:hypothetical protein